ncbi:WDR74 isoform 10 [Pongo abelii]|uniref:WDR74 isoform 10 n=1 Tax=Pongo abelii TaxID=9601 RepID=A0A2J8TY38_PONAB|nr:WDR74 isoform 10 [Pongo abelii]
MAAAAARWNHVWVGTETGILKGGWQAWASGSAGVHSRPWRD